MSKSEKVYVSLDYKAGPILGMWDEDRQVPWSGFDVIDDDPVVYDLQRKIIELYYPLWKRVPPTDDNPSGVDFDLEKEKELGPVLYDLLSQLDARLEEINDGSYEVFDTERPYLRKQMRKRGMNPGKAKDMVTIRLSWDEGPLDGWWDEERRVPTTGLDIIDGDPVVYDLQREIMDLYFPLWECGPGDKASFRNWTLDKKEEKKLAPKLLELVNKLADRLEEINDGTYKLFNVAGPHFERMVAEGKKADESDKAQKEKTAS